MNNIITMAKYYLFLNAVKDPIDASSIENGRISCTVPNIKSNSNKAA